MKTLLRHNKACLFNKINYTGTLEKTLKNLSTQRQHENKYFLYDPHCFLFRGIKKILNRWQQANNKCNCIKYLANIHPILQNFIY